MGAKWGSREGRKSENILMREERLDLLIDSNMRLAISLRPDQNRPPDCMRRGSPANHCLPVFIFSARFCRRGRVAAVITAGPGEMKSG